MEGHFREGDIDQIYRSRTDHRVFLNEGVYTSEEEYLENGVNQGEGYKVKVEKTVDGMEVKVSSPEEEITEEVGRDILKEQSDKLAGRSSETLPMPSQCKNHDEAIAAYAIYALKSRDIEGMEMYEMDWNGFLGAKFEFR